MDESQVLQNYVFRHDFHNVIFWYRAINKRYASLECRVPLLFYYYFFELKNLVPKFSYTLLKLTLPPAYGYQHTQYNFSRPTLLPCLLYTRWFQFN